MSTIEELLAADKTPRYWENDDGSYYLSADDVASVVEALAWYHAMVGEAWIEDTVEISVVPCCDIHDVGDPICTPTCLIMQRVWDFSV